MQKQDNQVFHFLTVGIVKLLWQYSRTALFLFVLPTWLFFFSQLGIVIGLSLDDIAFATGFYCIGGLCFALMLASLWFGFRAAQGFCRIIALVQIAWATIFSLVSTYRNIFDSTGPPFEPDSIECIVSLFGMFLLFIITVVVDTAKLFREQRAME